MWTFTLLAALCVACWGVAVSTPLLVGAVAPLAGLYILANVVAPLKFMKYGIGKRSVQDGSEEEMNLLLSTAIQLDPKGCILKLLCLLQTKETSTLSAEEKLLGDIFSNHSDALSAASASYVFATQVGAKTHDAATCNKVFSKCSLEDAQLQNLFQQASGCSAAS